MIKYLFDTLIPKSLRADVVQYSYAKTIVGIGLIAIVIIPVFSFIYYFMGINEIVVANIMEGFIICLAILLMRITGSIIIPRELIVLSLTILLTWISFQLGGLVSPSVFWLVLPPLICIITGGFKSSIVWSVMSSAIIIWFYFHERATILPIYYYLPLLIFSIIGFLFVIVTLIYISERGKIKGLKLQYRAYHDVLTGAINRFTFEDELKKQLNHANIHTKSLALITLDVDNFNSVNNTLGFEAGDFLLNEITKRLTAFFPKKSYIARVGNDEFSIIFHYKDLNHTKVLISNLLLTLKKPYSLNEFQELNSSCSMGAAFFPEDATTFATMIRYSNLALERAKYLSGNNIQYFNKEMAKEDAALLTIQHHLPFALKNNELSLLYQPKFLSSSRHVIAGMEVLLRWYNPILGNVPPDIFIPIAEKMGLISEIGHWVLTSSLTQYKDWENRHILKNTVTIAVNFSIHQIRKENILELIEEAFAKTNVSPSCFEVEITESVLLENKEYVIHTLNRLKQLGVLIVLDDFGVGYSSLSYLQQLPITMLKIDKIFIDNLVKDQRIITTIIDLAHKLKLKVTAEGIENEEQLTFLNSKECDYVQGFYLSKPLSAKEMESLLITAPVMREV